MEEAITTHEPAAYLVDLDGTLISEGGALPGAARLLDRLGERWALLSNNAEHTPDELAPLLAGIGLNVPARRIVLAGTCTLDLLATEYPGARVLLLASESLVDYARMKGLVPSADTPQLVVVARDPGFDYGRLALAANAVRQGAVLVGTNPDHVHPGRNGQVVPETGSLLAAVMAAAGVARCRVIGKPELPMFDSALSILGTSAHNTVMIGDNDETDGVGARRASMRFISASAGLDRVLAQLGERDGSFV